MPFGYVEAGAAVVGAVGSLTSKGGGQQGPSAAGWATNAAGLQQLMTVDDIQYNPEQRYGQQWADQYGQSQALGQQASAQANQFNQGAQQLFNQQQGLTGQVRDASNAYLNSGQQQAYQQSMNALQPGYYGAGQQAFNIGNQLYGQMGQAQGYGNQVMQTAFDPQKALYNQQFQLQQQQADANQAMRGLATSGVGAELSNQADQNFNIAWQNQQLQRQTQGLSAYDTNLRDIAGLGQGANQAYSQGLQDFTTGAGLPYNTAQTIYGNNQAAYGNQQAALQAQQAQFLAQQQTAQQGLGNQANMLTGQQQALANQQNNLGAGNAWQQQQIQNLLGYSNNSIPSWGQGQQAATANGYAGLGQYLGSGSFQNSMNQAQNAYNNYNNPSYTQQQNAALSNPNVTNIPTQTSYGTDYNPYANASAWAGQPADVGSFYAIPGAG